MQQKIIYKNVKLITMNRYSQCGIKKNQYNRNPK